jgi:ribonuclease R
VPAIYRVHAQPDPARVERLVEQLAALGVPTPPLGQGLSAQEAGRVAAEASRLVGREAARRGHGREAYTSLVLRSLNQAAYSERNSGHAGLGSAAYTHFTSPIRRYPDLVVHRSLRESRHGLMSEARRSELEEDLPEVARHTSEKERRADDAERELVQWKKVRFMADKVGDEFTGYITGVSAYGLYIELVEHFVEGMVHVSTMADDYYRFVEKAHLMRGENLGKVYRLGDKVTVQVVRVDLERRRVDLGLVDILDAVRQSERNRGPRRSKAEPKREAGRRKSRPGKKERADRKRR